MDNDFENIVPWNGGNDTGRDVRLKLERNFEKIKLNFQEIYERIFDRVEIGEGVIKWDEKYSSFVLQKKDGSDANLIIQGGTTFYGNPIGVPTIFDGLPIDHDTIYWEDGILKAQGGGGGGLSQVTIKLGSTSYASVDGIVSLPAYPATPDLSRYALKTDLPDFSKYALTSDLSKYVTLESEQAISGLKKFAEKIQIGDGVIKWNSTYSSFVLEKKDGTEANLIIQGGTAFYGNPTGVPIIFDGLPIDHSTIYWEDGILKAQGGGGGLSQVTIKLGSTSYQSVDGVVSLPAYPTMPDLGKYVTLDTDQAINGVKTFNTVRVKDWIYFDTDIKGISANSGLSNIYYIKDQNAWSCNVDFKSHMWFINANNSTGLYNAINDARWFSDNNYWKSNKDIMTINGRWFMNDASGSGLYNAQENARWYADVNCWNSDKEIKVNGFSVLNLGNYGSYVVKSLGTSNDNIDADYGECFKTFDPATIGSNPTGSLCLNTINVGRSFFRRSQLCLAYDRDTFHFRRRIDDSWKPWIEVITSANIGNQTVFNADMVDNLHISYNAVGDTVAARTAEGYIKATYYNTANPIENVGTTFFMEKDGDGFIRKSTWNYAQNILNHSQQTLDLRDAKYDQNTWYPCTINVGAPQCVNIKIFNTLVGDFNKPSWATHVAGFTINLQWSVTGSGWGGTVVQRTIKNNFFNFTINSVNPCGGIDQDITNSMEVVWLRGGAIYYYNIDNGNILVVHKDGFTDKNNNVYGTRTQSQLVNPDHCYMDSVFAVSNIHTLGLRILELPSVENTWNNRFNNSEGAIVQTTPYNGRYDQFITANSYQPLARWSNTINGVGYPTTYAIGSSRGGNTWGYMTFSVSNSDTYTTGNQLQLRGNGTMYWSGELQLDSRLVSSHVVTNGITVNGDINANGVTGSLFSNDWVRITPAGCGVSFSAHGGGIYMNDELYVRLYANKSFRVDGIISAGESTEYYYGYVNVARSSSSNNQSCFAMIRPGHMGFGIGYNTSNQVVIGSASPDRYVTPWLSIGATTSVFYSDLIIHGDTTFDTSDMTKKTPLTYINDIPIDDIANTPLFTFTWKDHRNSRNHMGTSAQYMQTVLPLSVREVNGELAHSYALSGFTYAVILARNFTNFITDYKSDKEKMQEEINTLKERIEKLERREVCQ